MVRSRSLIAAAAARAVAALPAVAALSVAALSVLAQPAAAAQAVPSGQHVTAAGGGLCSAGARTLSPPGSRLYPETGNGGYRSRHTLVRLVYDAKANRFLPGTSVVLTDVATQCLTSFSLDFERKSANKTAGPDLSVGSVTVNGRAAGFRFAQPTYPGDPNGPDDPNPAAHEASQTDPVGGPARNPLPPACTPELHAGQKPGALDGTQCPANKLVITPAAPISRGAVFTVTVRYTGRPGVHNDGDGTTEGWFRAPDGGFVTTEPVGSEDWMPLNDYPSAKPAYDFADTVAAGKVVVASGKLGRVSHHAPSRAFPHGSVTWHWHSAAPIASYLVEDSIGNYSLAERTTPGGLVLYQAQDKAIPAMLRKRNRVTMDKQAAVTRFESRFSGPYPFGSDGIVIGTPQAGFEEEMQTMIAFAASSIDLGVLYHENMHQWWGDNVTEGGYRMTFFKEGMATLGEFLFHASLAEKAAGGPGTPAGRAAFQASLVHQFNALYGRRGQFWTVAPSNPEPASLFSGASTYDRPAAAYLVLRQILGHGRFVSALRAIQAAYGGGSITEPQLEAGFARWLPNRGAGCRARLGTFFRQWFDTAYPPGGVTRRPRITGPGLDGQDFYGQGGCTAR